MDHDGQMMLALDAEALRLYCRGVAEYTCKLISNVLEFLSMFCKLKLTA
jgi:phytoene/squalene synthetase